MPPRWSKKPRPAGTGKPQIPRCERLFMRQLQLLTHGEPSDVIELNTVAESALGQEDVLISMEASPLNPSDFLFVRGMNGIHPAFPSPTPPQVLGRATQTASQFDSPLQ